MPRQSNYYGQNSQPFLEQLLNLGNFPNDLSGLMNYRDIQSNVQEDHVRDNPQPKKSDKGLYIVYGPIDLFGNMQINPSFKDNNRCGENVSLERSNANLVSQGTISQNGTGNKNSQLTVIQNAAKRFNTARHF